MRLLTFILFASIIFVACKSKDKEPESKPAEPVIAKDSLLVTDTSWGVVTKDLSFTDLVGLFGKEQLKDERICGPECADSIDVTYIFPGTDKEITVYWKAGAWHKNIAFLETYKEKSPYYTSDSLKIGSTLDQLLNKNGQKISFSGFGWDYGGYIQSYNGGTLDSSQINYRLDINDEGTALLGDSNFDTDMPAAKKALTKIKVWQLQLSFDK